MNNTVVVIGNGMVGYKFCEKLIAKGDFNIICFGEEPRRAYDRVHLSEYFNGKTSEELSLSPLEWYKKNNISLHLNDPVLEIDLVNKRVKSKKGIVQSYDHLVLATGSSAFVPQIPGIDKQGIFVYRTIEDMDAIQTYARTCKTGVVMGGGLLGLEAAKAMLDLGLAETHVLEFASRLMPRQIDSAGSIRLQKRLESLGLIMHLNKSTVEIGGDKEIRAIRYADGTELECDLLVISAGIRPRDQLAKEAGIECGARGGIVVSQTMQTSAEHVYAIGECALYKEMIYGLVAPGYDMAEVAAIAISGGSRSFNGFDMSTKLKLIGVDVASFGDPFISGELARSIVFEDELKGIYKRINISHDGSRLLGGILIGDAEAYNMLMQTVTNQVPLPADPGTLIMSRSADAAESKFSVMNLADTAVICSCESITKGEILGAVREKNISNLDELKKVTKAGTCCGGCVPLLKDLMLSSMKADGIYIREVICEHFSYSRQELFDLFRLDNIRDFDQALDMHGKGDGCEVCKPVVASIFSGLWNELIVKQAPIQDSNDRYLANLQKGGTYSVVPRIPGGEITPDKLIAIGHIAKKYGLYTKITGGQRIDMFGAPVQDLPAIWKELIDAGFESGQAYGKSLRTVKSCVGSTWCRFGLHDSVSLAIEVEDRYKGIRSPHKLKGGVSGCVRECAEAQSKDFGIIATEKGWNLYVCGNGGSKPQHAVLMATDIDKESLIRYLDRFLMFYIKTADPLSRTATWLNKMEGGITYLKNVIVHDSLGIGASLENEIQALIGTYHCEWKEVVESQELRRNFVPFVNAPETKDSGLTFVPMREMIRAKEW